MLRGSQGFFDDIAGKMMVEIVGVEVPAGEFEGVKRNVRREMQKKKKKRNEKRGASQRDKGEL